MESIIVRAPNWLGDAIMALPVFPALREKFPRTRLAVACRENLRDVFAAAPEIDEVIGVPRGNGALLRHAWNLRARRFDLGILLTNSFATAAWLRLAGVRRRIGYARDGRGFLLTDAVMATPFLLAAHQAEYYFALLRECGIDTPLGMPRLTLPPEAHAEAEAYLKRENPAGRPFAVVAPCSAFGAVKDWAPERYAAVARELAAQRQLDVFVTGVADQNPVIASICGNGDSTEKDAPRVINAAGALSLFGLFALIRRAAVFIGGDSGAAHAAAAVNTPVVVIFGITEPSRTRPLGNTEKIRVLGEGGMETPDLRSPAVAAAARRALNAITPENVLKAAGEILAT